MTLKLGGGKRSKAETNTRELEGLQVAERVGIPGGPELRHSTDKFRTPEKISRDAELDRGMAHIEAEGYEFHVGGEHPPPAFAFDNVGTDILENEDDLYDCTLSEYPNISSFGLEKEQRVTVSPRPPLPVTPPIWAQVRRLIYKSTVVIWSLVSTGSLRIP